MTERQKIMDSRKSYILANAKSKTLCEIAQALSISQMTARGIYERMGLPVLSNCGRRKEALKNFILSSHNEKSISDIADECGFSYATVARACRELGVKPFRLKTGRKKTTASRDEMIECLARNGFTYESIGDAFGVTRQRIEQIINGGRK